MVSDSFRMQEWVAFGEIKTLLKEGKRVFPAASKKGSFEDVQRSVYRALSLTPLDEVRVVILGQDPYHGLGQANGLAFSVPEGVPLPPSLRNIFKELQDDYNGELRTNGDLSDWAKQGVLLLNSSLSVVEGKPNSMSHLWEPLTDEMIRFIDANVNPVVFVLWGNNARRKKALIVNNSEYVIESAHPSPLSAHRGFFGSKPFSKVNGILRACGAKPINWLHS